ncbi:uncharacterized protein LOC100375375 [Saccoglossus kowalevskii]|uniref:Protein SPT2 homolog n=1 Tax=Saccoglossus kowalevskii TaxID=10224 RepID=A0ABM0GRT3_SACKO|nr:PREDICTED: protein SPT2 homolog [Saccoglossus kowalevskii]
MDFNQLMSFAATNQKQAEKKLVHIKRYSTIVPPPKKDVKKVNTGAIKAILEKKSNPIGDRKKNQIKEDSATLQATERKISSKQSSVSKPSVKPSTVEQPQLKHKNKDHIQKHQTSVERVKIPDKKDGKIRTLDKSRGGVTKTSEKIKEKLREEKRTDVKTIPKSFSAKKTGPNPSPMDFSELMKLAEKRQHEPPSSRKDVVCESKPSTSNGRISSKNHRSRTDAKPSTSNGKITTKDKQSTRHSASNGKILPKDKQSTRVSMSNGKSIPNSTNDGRDVAQKKMTSNDINRIKGKETIRKTTSKVTDRTIDKTSHHSGNQKVSKEQKSVSDKQKLSSRVPQNHTKPGPSRVSEQPFNSRSKDKFVSPPPPHPLRPPMPLKRPAMPPPSRKVKKRRRLDSDSDYEDDGFIDDSPMDNDPCDVSSFIKQIFGYDKNKYGYESDYSLRNMDASFSQIQKEEARSYRLGLQEDMEELRKEKEEEARKLARKKKAMKSKK